MKCERAVSLTGIGIFQTPSYLEEGMQKLDRPVITVDCMLTDSLLRSAIEAPTSQRHTPIIHPHLLVLYSITLTTAGSPIVHTGRPTVLEKRYGPPNLQKKDMLRTPY